MKRRQKKSKKSNKIGIVCISMVGFLNIIGVGYGCWAEGLIVEGVVSTGNIDPIFSECSVVEKNPEDGLAEVKLDESGKNIHITISNAHPGYSSSIYYKVANRGTIPVEYEVSTNEIESMDNLDSPDNEKSADIVEATDNIEADKVEGNNMDTPTLVELSEKRKPPIILELNNSVGIIEACGESEEGIITITLGEVKEKANYDFSVDLNFHQWNEEK